MRQKSITRPKLRAGSTHSSINNEANIPTKNRKSSGDYLQAIINSLEDELMVIGRDYRIIEINDKALSRHGKSRQEVVGQYCYEVSHDLHQPCSSPYHECPIKDVLETGKPARTTHIHVYNFNGKKRERYVDIVASPIVDSQGNVNAITELMRDITEIRVLELRIAQNRQNLLALNTIASTVNQSLDLDIVLKSALDKTLEIMQRSIGGILLFDEEREILRYRAHRGLSDKYAKEMCLRLGEGIAGTVAQTGEAILLNDILMDPRAACPDLIIAEGIRAFACVPLRSKEEVLGVLNVASHEVQKFSSDDVRLLGSIAAQIAIAVENARLHKEVRHKEEIRGELLQDIFLIQEEERRRISRELHDETSQALASLVASLEASVSMMPDSADKTKAILRKAQTLSISIMDEIQKLIYELRPTLLDDLGLVAAIRWLVDNNLGLAGIKVKFITTRRVRRLAAHLETTVFRVIQEAIYNIAKHAEAKNTDLRLHFKKSMIDVYLKDDGKGFDVKEAISSKDRPRGLGLLGMRERIELVNGTWSIRSCPGNGTEINIKIPLN